MLYAHLTDSNSFCSSTDSVVMSAGVDALLDAARFLELQERERSSGSSSSASSLSTSPYSRYPSSKNNQNYSASTPPASPLSDGQRNGDFNGGSTIIRSGKRLSLMTIRVNNYDKFECKKRVSGELNEVSFSNAMYQHFSLSRSLIGSR